MLCLFLQLRNLSSLAKDLPLVRERGRILEPRQPGSRGHRLHHCTVLLLKGPEESDYEVLLGSK